MDWLTGIALVAFVVLVYAIQSVVDSVNKLPERLDARMRRTMVDYAEYLDARRKASERFDELLREENALSQDDERYDYKRARLDYQFCAVELREQTKEDEFLGPDESFRTKELADRLERLRAQVEKHDR